MSIGAAWPVRRGRRGRPGPVERASADSSRTPSRYSSMTVAPPPVIGLRTRTRNAPIGGGRADQSLSCMPPLLGSPVVPVIHIDTRARTTMNDELAGGPTSFGHLNLEEKLEYLQVLSDVVRDIEVELARAEAERGALK